MQLNIAQGLIHIMAKLNILREYIKILLIEQGYTMGQVEFSGVLKLMPDANIVASVSILAEQLPPEAKLAVL